jgi:hypothetical protein
MNAVSLLTTVNDRRLWSDESKSRYPSKVLAGSTSAYPMCALISAFTSEAFSMNTM